MPEQSRQLINHHFEAFLKSGLYLRGWSTRTPVIYRRAFTSFQQSLQLARGVGIEPTQPDLESSSPDLGTRPLTKAHLEAWVVWMRERGRTPAGCNVYVRAMNAFCSYLVEQGVLLLTVLGKGSKERKVPFSPEMRKHLWAFMNRAPRRYVFGTKNDTRMTYRNAYRSVKLCFAACGVTGAHVQPRRSRPGRQLNGGAVRGARN